MLIAHGIYVGKVSHSVIYSGIEKDVLLLRIFLGNLLGDFLHVPKTGDNQIRIGLGSILHSPFKLGLVASHFHHGHFRLVGKLFLNLLHSCLSGIVKGLVSEGTGYQKGDLQLLAITFLIAFRLLLLSCRGSSLLRRLCSGCCGSLCIGISSASCQNSHHSHCTQS